MGHARSFMRLALLIATSGVAPFAGADDPEPPAAPDVAELIAAGEYELALVPIEARLAEAPDSVQALVLRGHVRLKQGDAGGARSDLERALEIDPASTDAALQLAQLHGSAGRSSEALAVLRAAAERGRGAGRGVALIALGQLERDAGNVDAAIAAFEESVASDPDLQATVAAELADLYTRRGDTSQAQLWLERSSAGGGVDPVAEYNLGVEHFNRKEWERAAACFERAVAADPQLGEAYRGLGHALLQLQRGPEAVAHLRRYVELRPDAADAAKVRAFVDAHSP